MKARLRSEIRRRTDSVGTFLSRDSIIRLVGAVLAEQTNESAAGRRYLGLDVLARCRLAITTYTVRAVATEGHHLRSSTVPLLLPRGGKGDSYPLGVSAERT